MTEKKGDQYHGSNTVKEKALKEKAERREIVRKVIREDGFSSVPELQSILANKYDIKVSVEAVHNDLRFIDAFTEEDKKAFNNNMMANCEKMLTKLNTLSETAKYDNHKIYAIRAYFASVKDMQRIVELLTEDKILSPEEVEKKVEKKEEPEEIKIEFGEE